MRRQRRPPAPNLAEVAQQQGFTALVAAATKADLVTTLAASHANLTVLAPTDAAFTALATRLGFSSAAAMVAALDGLTLAKILTYHVLPVRETATELISGPATQRTVYSLGGSPATMALSSTSGLRLGDAVLTQAIVTTGAVAASNGIVHVIDKVLIPPGVLNIVQMAQANPAFSTLVGAVVSRNLAGTLSGAGPFTVFAPTNDTFAAMSGTCHRPYHRQHRHAQEHRGRRCARQQWRDPRAQRCVDHELRQLRASTQQPRGGLV